MSAWCVVAAFGTYFCMYFFRKPFAACKYEGLALWGNDYKTVLVVAQVLGYTLSKFFGIKIIAELNPQRRIAGIVLLIAGAEAALLGFALTPPPYSFVFLFVNGLPLGMVFGMVLAFLEGRRVTELLTAGLCASFILADGAAKSLGAYLLAWRVPDAWMPCIAGLVAVVPMAVFVWMLAQIPAPSLADVAQRSVRAPMDARQRWRFFRTYAPGLAALLLMFMMITVLRSIRSDYAAEIWSGLLGKEVNTPPQVFTSSEMVVAAMVMLANGLCFLIKDSRKAFFTALAIGGGGTALVVASVAGLHYGLLDGFAFMVLVGSGLYLPYVAIHTTIFERLIAMTRDRGNLGYLMYLADSFGYLGYVVVMLVCKLCFGRTDALNLFALNLFSTTCLAMAVLSLACIVLAAVYFRNVGSHAVSEAVVPLLNANEAQADEAASAGAYAG
jgi:hypothetical protein